MDKTAVVFLKKVPLHLLFCAVVWFFFFSFFSVGSQNADFIFWFSTILSAITIVASYVFNYHLIPNFLLLKKYLKFIIFTFYTSVFIICAVLMTMVFGFVFFYNLEYQKMPSLTKNYGVILVCIVLIISLSSAFKILKSNYQSLDEKKTIENKFLQTQLQLKEQELNFLKMQIHPHFLFNTLNTMYGFALKKSDKTPEMILKLSNLLDYILYQIGKPSVLLIDEVKHIKNYISLEKLRFQESLIVDLQVDVFHRDLQISPMLLLPFVENAFKHGVQINEVLEVKIRLESNGQSLFFEIENSAKINRKSKRGIGLENIKKRLEMLYQEKYLLEILEQDNSFKVTLKIEL